MNNNKFNDWLKTSTFETCKLNRKEYGQFLADYITEEHDGFVLNIDGAWGTGKTEFLKRLYSELHSNRNHPVIYIDAWESDFSDNPLTVVTSELLNQLSAINDDIGKHFGDVKAVLGKFLKGSLIGAAGLMSKSLIGEASIGQDLIKTLYEKEPSDFMDDLKDGYSEQIEAISEIRNTLHLLAEVVQKNYGKQLPVIVLVDELDRCRPTYAIEMLEVIKHFFQTKGFVFVVATDTEQLTHSIKAVYGAEFNSKQYLKRFFNRRALLPKPDIKHYLNALKLNFSTYQETLKLYPYYGGRNHYFLPYIEILAEVFHLEIRDIDQIVSKLIACLRSAKNSSESTGKIQVINTFALLIAIVEFDVEQEQFNERTNYKKASGYIGSELELFKGIDINQVHDITMDTITLHIKPEPHFEEEVYERMRYKHLQSLNSLSNEGKYLAWYDQIKANISLPEDTHKHWLWEDYKKVVVLAGNIK